MKQRLKLCLILMLMFASLLSRGQSTELFFGMNYWEYADWGSGVTDAFQDNMAETSTWGFSFIRVGGNHSNAEGHAQVKEWYDQPIQNILSMGAEPLVQFPINLDPAQVSVWMDYFNVTRGYNIKYWAIGNEPDPSGDGSSPEVFTRWDQDQLDNELGNTYTQFRGKFRTLATEIKKKDPNSVICGPDFRHWWGIDTGSPYNAFDNWYKDFLYGDGDWAVGTDDYNGDQLVDIFAFHWYGNDGEDKMIQRYELMMDLIDETNARRPANQPLKIAVGEYNQSFSNALSFEAGQHMAIMAKQSLAHGAVYFTPWSISEGANWRMINKSTGEIYSTGHHWKMLCQNQKGSYMEGQIQDNKGYDIMEFGMKDATGYTIMLMNKSDIDYSIAVNFSESPNTYNPNAADLKFRFDANEPNAAFSGVTLHANSTILYTYNNNGERLKKLEYRMGYTEPTVYNFPNVDPTTGFDLSFETPNEGTTYDEAADVPVTVLIDPAPADLSTEYSVALYLQKDNDPEFLVRQENMAPYDWANDLVGLTAGQYTLRALATLNSTQETKEAYLNFVVNAPVPQGDPLTENYFHFINQRTGDYMRPVGGAADADVVMYQEVSEPTYSSYEWQIEVSPLDATNYFITNKWTNQAILPGSAAVTANTPIEQMDASLNWNAMQWRIIPSNEAGYYWIQNVKSGLYIRPQGGQYSNNQGAIPVVQDVLNETYSSFRWTLNAKEAIPAARFAHTESIEQKGGLDTKIILYPNPASDRINLSQSSEWNLLDVMGRNIMTGQGKTIETNVLKSGLYWVKVKDQTIRVVISK
ncbi:T9SS type A sorting domain-containing protein [Reichenbachiella ulvae]|uniref:T9SS type A sorting domain-containing protein n=1 Tax=Reichenbachiella ulvae TaxID=2980104 RepID=A0ABT3CV64_9BACT|nr:T9SS type A sorting domain-containing protein [Reichenbachiella ulvae]MCV9387414.1 T9SS type A sorting domain-containing protein [Reichenbachiella ulvae]